MKPRVLIVDDSLTVRMDLSEALEASGFATVLHASATAARAAIADDRFDLVVLDVNLPDGDGVELLAEIKRSRATSRVPVMLLSSEVEVKDRIRGLATGADEYVGKPYDAGWIIARARELVHTAAGAQRETARQTVLVVDDSATFRAEISGSLRSAGYEVSEAASGEDGLRVAATLRPAAMIVDGVLPGIDGATVVRRIRLDAVLRNTPCLLLTASDAPGGESTALDIGADAYLRKESDARPVIAWLSVVLRMGASVPVAAMASLHAPKRVLAVDDSPTFLAELSERLSAEGYDVVVARSGEEAIRMLSVQRVDAILLDLVMPGLSGQETCQRIKGEPSMRDVPLMMLTAREGRESMIEGINAGADDYIAKSADFAVLVSRLRAQLRRRQFEDETRRMREELLRNAVDATEARAARELADVRAALLADLERKNEELARVNRDLEAFSYSVSHDLRAPLRAIDGFARAVATDHAAQLDEEGRDYLRRVLVNAARMEALIEDLLNLARVTRGSLRRVRVDVSALAHTVLAELRSAAPERDVVIRVHPEMTADADAGLLRIALENLLSNAWKFTASKPTPAIEVGVREVDGGQVYFVRDDGPGFEMASAKALFRPFQRLANSKGIQGTGIGLATVQRIVERHGGAVWAEAEPGTGATFSFTLG